MTNAVRIPRLLFFCGLLLFVAMNSARAVDPSQPLSDYLRSHITDHYGPGSVVDQIVQSRDGFLWIANGGQLIRFDGHHSTPFDQPHLVLALAVAPDGDLWVGTTDHLERVPVAALSQSGRLPAISYHPGPGVSSNILCLHF